AHAPSPTIAPPANAAASGARLLGALDRLDGRIGRGKRRGSDSPLMSGSILVPNRSPTGVCATGHDPSGKGGLMVRRRLVSAWLVVLALIPAPWTLPCGVERWSVKTGTDADSGLVDVASSTSNTISTMRGWTAPNPIPANNRV